SWGWRPQARASRGRRAWRAAWRVGSFRVERKVCGGAELERGVCELFGERGGVLGVAAQPGQLMCGAGARHAGEHKLVERVLQRDQARVRAWVVGASRVG